ncbi:FAD:protein FMN transferase [Pelolinea submarina]|uniref:FAD:protein FMN transferase n=1 Tax=Pelolinea submarina TaxID=913107 RepID=A0A347ZQ37_9CHLR|nr:FAD:protein FMN transferase [Pelolinea submarina]REG06253.1 thiamine biosynthesis lipoprotein [Pelolinea submarina]BBB47418.1 FAD:protein FMN transferase [Pelolinea submarina]
MFTDVAQAESRIAQDTQLAMGTVMAYRIWGTNAQACLEAVFGEIARLEGLFSRFDPDSEISRINRSAGRSSEAVSFTTMQMLRQALDICAECPGYFDPTIGPLVALWNIGKGSFAVPGAAKIQRALDLVDYRDLLLDPAQGTAGLRRSGQSLDLGGIAKGFAADQVMNIFQEYDVRSAYANLGGNVAAWGGRPDGFPWQVGIQHPRSTNGLIGAVAVRNGVVVTSGDYQRFVTDPQGRRFHHLLDASSGYPAATDLLSVTVAADSGVLADAYATSLFIAGKAGARRMLREHPEIEAVLVGQGGQIYVTKGLAERFQPAEGIRVKIFD